MAVSFPLGLLCLYLGCLGWRKNQMASVVLLLFGAFNLGIVLAASTFLFFLSRT